MPKGKSPPPTADNRERLTGSLPARNIEPAIDEGYIKFHLSWIEDEAPPGISELIDCRNRLHRAGLIGAYSNGVGYGNISVRSDQGFIISGSQTGIHEVARAEHFTEVVGYSFEENTVSCRGPAKPSSEALTHAAVYEASPTVRAVAHAHHRGLWNALLGKVPTTSADVAYGTPEMAMEIARLFRETDIETRRLLIMAGHEEGLVGFGASLEEASQALLELL